LQKTTRLIVDNTATIFEIIFYSTFRLMRKPSSGINEMQQLEGKIRMQF